MLHLGLYCHCTTIVLPHMLRTANWLVCATATCASLCYCHVRGLPACLLHLSPSP